jgi:hypothetical protein
MFRPPLLCPRSFFKRCSIDNALLLLALLCDDEELPLFDEAALLRNASQLKRDDAVAFSKSTPKDTNI